METNSSTQWNEFVLSYDGYERHLSTGDNTNAREFLIRAMMCCPSSSLLALLAVQLRGVVEVRPFNFWLWLRQTFGNPNPQKHNQP